MSANSAPSLNDLELRAKKLREHNQQVNSRLEDFLRSLKNEPKSPMPSHDLDPQVSQQLNNVQSWLQSFKQNPKALQPTMSKVVKAIFHPEQSQLNAQNINEDMGLWGQAVSSDAAHEMDDDVDEEAENIIGKHSLNTHNDKAPDNVEFVNGRWQSKDPDPEMDEFEAALQDDEEEEDKDDSMHGLEHTTSTSSDSTNRSRSRSHSRGSSEMVGNENGGDDHLNVPGLSRQPSSPRKSVHSRQSSIGPASRELQEFTITTSLHNVLHDA